MGIITTILQVTKLRQRSLNGISKVTHIIVVDPRFEPNQDVNLVPESMVLTIVLHYTISNVFSLLETITKKWR